jgi:hypothetical protein
MLINHKIKAINSPAPFVVQLGMNNVTGSEQLFNQSLDFTVNGSPCDIPLLQFHYEFIAKDFLQLVTSVVHHCKVSRIIITLSFVQSVIFIRTSYPELLINVYFQRKYLFHCYYESEVEFLIS